MPAPSIPNGGDTWTRPTDGAVMVYVPAGEFLMGSSDDDIDAVAARRWVCVTSEPATCRLADGIAATMPVMVALAALPDLAAAR